MCESRSCPCTDAETQEYANLSIWQNATFPAYSGKIHYPLGCVF